MLQALLAQGQAALALGNLAAATVAFNAALAISPNDPTALTGLAEIKRISDRRAARLLEINRLLGIATQAMRAQQFSDAIKAYRDVLALDSDNVPAIEGLREARYQKAMHDGQQANLAKKYKDAVRFYEEALREKPGDPAATGFLTQARINAKQK
jgi:tetratricopeptide (TPR) repeat protein